jgi:hypothetical protein
LQDVGNAPCCSFNAVAQETGRNAALRVFRHPTMPVRPTPRSIPHPRRSSGFFRVCPESLVPARQYYIFRGPGECRRDGPTGFHYRRPGRHPRRRRNENLTRMNLSLIAMSDKIRSYAELRELIRLSLRAQNQEWVEPDCDSPICASYEAWLFPSGHRIPSPTYLMRLSSSLAPSRQPTLSTIFANWQI